MSDLRDKQPDHRALDASRMTSGNNVYEFDLILWPYSGLKNEDVVARKTTVKLRAMSIENAFASASMALMIAKSFHDVWEGHIARVEEVAR